MRTSIVSILLLCFVTYVSANAKGSPNCAPTIAAMTAAGAMGKEAQLPITMTASSTTYTPGKDITLTTKGSYAGIFATVMDAKGNRFGKMKLLDGLQFVKNCPGDADSTTSLTHTSAAKKTDLVLTWTAPPKDAGALTVQFLFVGGAKTGISQLTAKLTSAGGNTPPATNTTTGTDAPTGSGAPTGTGSNSPTGTGTGSATTTPTSNGMSISQYSSFGALVLANAAAVAILF